VPKEFRDKEICWEAVKQCGYALQYVPEALRDQEICLEAVKQDGMALDYVPEKFLDIYLQSNVVLPDWTETLSILKAELEFEDNNPAVSV
jgi:hypothetical protein